jgi:hypothetical protein
MSSITIATGPQWSKSRDAKRVETEALWAERGLAVHQAFAVKGWTVTHLASGYAVKAGISSHRNAITFARRLLDCGDWTRPRTAIATDRRLRDLVADAIAEAKLLGLIK